MNFEVIRQRIYACRLSLSTLIEVGLVLYLLLLVLGFVFVGDGPLFDFRTFLLGIGLGLLVTVAHLSERNRRNPLMAMVALIFLINMFLRLLGYLYFPTLVEFPFGKGVGVGVVNDGLLYIFLGTLCMLGGMVVAARLWPVWKTEVPGVAPLATQQMLWVWGAVFFIELMLELYITAWLGLSPLAVDKIHEYDGHHAIQALRAVVGLDTTLLAFFTYMALPGNWKAGRGQWGWVVALSLVLLMYTAYSGSRSGGLRLFMFVITILLVWRAGRSLTLLKIMAFVLAMAVLTPLSFSIGDYFRAQTHLKHTAIYKHELQQSKLDGGMHEAPEAQIPEVQAPALSNRVINRLGAGLDYAILVTTQMPAKGCVAGFMNLGYAAKNMVNSAVPGTVFPEAQLNTSRVVSICYRGMTASEVFVAGYHSEYWTIWGLALVMFGWWGGLIFLTVSGILLHVMYAIVWRFFPTGVKGYYATLYVFLLPWLVIFTMGLDHSVNTTILVGAQLGFALLLASGIALLLRRAQP
jgi:hypothetical protein